MSIEDPWPSESALPKVPALPISVFSILLHRELSDLPYCHLYISTSLHFRTSLHGLDSEFAGAPA